jgi:hypothetical protein
LKALAIITNGVSRFLANSVIIEKLIFCQFNLLSLKNDPCGLILPFKFRLFWYMINSSVELAVAKIVDALRNMVISSFFRYFFVAEEFVKIKKERKDIEKIIQFLV